VSITNATTMKAWFSHNCWICPIRSYDIPMASPSLLLNSPPFPSNQPFKSIKPHSPW
jgi:hypothetical protein